MTRHDCHLALVFVLFTARSVWRNRLPTTADIRDVVQRYVDAREARDPEAVGALFTADADQLVSSGEWRRGRDVLVKGTMASSARTTGTRTVVVETIRMVGPDVAMADGRYEISGAETRKMWSTFVMARQQGQWRISAIRNMLPAPPAAAAAATAPLEQEQVLAVVDRFMQAIATRNNAAFAEIRMKDTTSLVERPAEGGGTRLVHRPFDATLPAGNFVERYWDPVVHIRNGIAVVWTRTSSWRTARPAIAGLMSSSWRKRTAAGASET